MIGIIIVFLDRTRRDNHEGWYLVGWTGDYCLFTPLYLSHALLFKHYILFLNFENDAKLHYLYLASQNLATSDLL